MGKNDQVERPDAKSHEGFIARAFEVGGLKSAVKEANRLFVGYSDKEVSEAAASMHPKVRTAVMKMMNARKT